MPRTVERNVRVDVVADDDRLRALHEATLLGLQREVKELPAVWLYDARGSQLFAEITRLPEYYQTRTERALLERSADAPP